MSKKALLGLDVGTVRVGIALADTQVRIAIASGVVHVDGNEYTNIAKLIVDNDIDTVVVGYPRNQSGEPTEQTSYVETFVKPIRDMVDRVVFQDESLTSVMAEERLSARKSTFTKEEVDAEAAAIILQDYVEQRT